MSARLLFRRAIHQQFNWQPKITPEQSSKVLTVINESLKDDFNNFQISKSRVARIENWKQKNGKFSDISQLLELDGFGIKVVEKFMDSILNESSKRLSSAGGKSQSKSTQFTTPILHSETRSKISCFVSVAVGVSTVTWTQFRLHAGNATEVVDWNHFDIGEKRLHISDLVQTLIYIHELIPHADVFCMENPQVAVASGPGNPVQVNINIQRAQLIAMLSAMLVNRTRSEPASQNLFYLRQYVWSRLFRTLIGLERVSTEAAVLELMRVHYNRSAALENVDVPVFVNADVDGKCNFVASVRETYDNANAVKREFMGQSLLLGMAFLRLCVLECPISLAKLLSHVR